MLNIFEENQALRKIIRKLQKTINLYRIEYRPDLPLIDLNEEICID